MNGVMQLYKLHLSVCLYYFLFIFEAGYGERIDLKQFSKNCKTIQKVENVNCLLLNCLLDKIMFKVERYTCINNFKTLESDNSPYPLQHSTVEQEDDIL